MTSNANLNVYKGPDSVKEYFDPDSSPPYPLVEVPECLNPYRKDGVRIYAKMMSMHPANNVKAMPALNLLDKAVSPGKTDTIIEYSSGSTVISMSLVSRVFHQVPDVRAFLSNKTSRAKLRLMQFFGLDITLFGGPSQPEPLDDRGGIRAAQRMAEESDDVINPNQYENDDNWKAHVRWTGPQMLKQLPEISLICAGMGTSGTMTGLGTYFKDAKPSVYRLGVCTAAGERVPGPRSYALLKPVEFPWRSAVDHIEHVGTHDSYSLSLDLCRQGLVCGPSSGFNLQGLFQFLEKRKVEGTLKDLVGEGDEIHCAFLCCDLPYQYIDEYFDKLGPKSFPTIHNENLQDVDLYRYDEAWEKQPYEAFTAVTAVHHVTVADAAAGPLNSLQPRLPHSVVVDIRQPSDFAQLSFPSSHNIPVVDSPNQRPFSDPEVLEKLWLKLEGMFGPQEGTAPAATTKGLLEEYKSRPVLLVCYNGDCSRVAASVLRAKGFQADCVRGGFSSIESWASSMAPSNAAAGAQVSMASWNEKGGLVAQTTSIASR